MLKMITTLFLILFSVAIPSVAWTPTMVGQEIDVLRELGYEVCEPTISQLPIEEMEQGKLADAIPTPYGGVCEVRFAQYSVPRWVAHHEACHLATVNEIFADPVSNGMTDPAHEHPLFTSCLDYGPSERGGY